MYMYCFHTAAAPLLLLLIVCSYAVLPTSQAAQRVKHEAEDYPSAIKATAERVKGAGSHAAEVTRNQMEVRT